MAEQTLLALINEQLQQRGPLLLPRFGGSRLLVQLFRWEDAYVLLSSNHEMRLLSAWDVLLFSRALGLSPLC
jgi:hypothetical protein